MQGVVDTAVEAFLSDAVSKPSNTSALHRLATDLGQRHVAVVDESDFAMLSLDPSINSLMLKDRSTGHLIVIPGGDDGARIAWCRIDPRTGTTVGMGQRGAGQGVSDQLILMQGLATAAAAAILIY